MINNGLIILTHDSEKFIGGNLTFKVEEPSKVKHSTQKFFFYKDGNETSILTNSESIEGSKKGLRISSDMGSISSKNLFNTNDLEHIKKSLKFLLTGTFINGEKFDYSVVLNVEKVY